jgi:hypothetical protein
MLPSVLFVIANALACISSGAGGKVMNIGPGKETSLIFALLLSLSTISWKPISLICLIFNYNWPCHHT